MLILCLALARAGAGGGMAATRDQPFDEYQVKAAFLFNFAKFVEWPAGTFPTGNDPIAICILGEDPFGRSLDNAVAGKTVEGRSVFVRRIGGTKLLAGCQILFIAASESRHAMGILSAVKTRGLLVVGDSDIEGDGIVIGLRVESGRIRIEINLDAAESEKIRISSRLLSLAHIVDSRRK